MSDKRSQLIEATIDLFSKEGFWNTSTARISKHAKVATGTLFNYFESKEKLIDEVYIQLKQEMHNFIIKDFPSKGTTLERINHIWDGYALWAMAHPASYKLLDQLRLSDLISNEAQDRVQIELKVMFEVMQEAHEEGLFGQADLQFVAMFIHAGLEATINYAKARELSGQALKEHIQSGARILWAGLQAESP